MGETSKIRELFSPVIDPIPEKWRRPIGHFIVVFIFLLVGTLFYHSYEGWAPGTCLAFSVVTITTVGYGYHSPSDNASRIFTVFYMLFGIFFVFGGIADMINSSLQEMRERNAKRHKSDGEEAFMLLKRQMFFTCVMIVSLLFIGAFMFMGLEGWGFIKAFYFAVETSTTVGYGDLSLENGYTRIFLVFYIIFSTVLLAYGFNNFQSMKEEHEKLLKAYEFTRKKQTLSKIADLDEGDGVRQDTFILAVLEHLGVVDREKDIEPWIAKFKEIDADGSGAIDKEEIEMFTAKVAQEASQELTANDGRNSNFVAKLRYSLGFASTNTKSKNNTSDNDNDTNIRVSSNQVSSPMYPASNSLRSSLISGDTMSDNDNNALNGEVSNQSMEDVL